MKKHLFLIAIGFVATNSFAQWQPGGNNSFNPFLVNTTNNFIGTSASNPTPLKIGVTGSQDIFIDNLPGPPQLLPAGSGNPGVLQGGHWVGLGRIFFPSTGTNSNPQLAPQAHLHIHGGNLVFPNFTGGVRPWFQTGTLYTENSNGMYVGLKDLSIVPPNAGAPNSVNSTYAVINWSDDNYGGNLTDFLTFNFTGGGVGQLGRTLPGMELGRFNPSYDPSNPRGTFGVGNFQILGPSLIYTQPVRRVEILDADPATGNHPPGAGGGNPQLRLTYTYDQNPANGVWTEFQTTDKGDMFFNNFSPAFPTILQPRFFGFHTILPGNTVEINSNLPASGANNPLVPASWPASTGTSGLRFSDLRPTDAVVTPGPSGIDPTKVLSVDKNGDVVLINPQGTPPTNNGITTLPIGSGGPIIQLGVDCNNLTLSLLAQATLQTNRLVFLDNKNLVFYDATGNTGKVGIGNLPAFCGPANTLEIGADAGAPHTIPPQVLMGQVV
jgi:hypothetical protein